MRAQDRMEQRLDHPWIEARVSQGLLKTAPHPEARERARALAGDLRLRLGGEVRFDDQSRALWATDAGNYRQVPIGVVLPRDVDDIVATVEICRRHDAPIVARGGGTSLAGQACNVAVVIDTSKYVNRVLELDPERRLARVEPGLVLDDLRHQTEKHHLTFAPDPATHDRNTLGGMIGNNSCGVHSVMGGKTVDNVESLEVLTYDGARMHVGATSDRELARIVGSGGRRAAVYRSLLGIRALHAREIRARFPRLRRRVSGYNLDQLLPENGFHVGRALVGTEGTCAMVLGATVRLIPSPRFRVLVVLGYPDVFAAADDVPRVLEHRPIALEGMDDVLVDDMRRKGLHVDYLTLLPEGRGWLLAELGGDTAAEARGAGQRLVDSVRHGASAALVDDARRAHQIWTVRESGLGATARVPGDPDTWEGWEDSAVPVERLGEYLRVFRHKLDEHGYVGALYGHFGDGCVHTRISFDLRTRGGVAHYRRFVEEMADVVVEHGGSLSGEHGDGAARAELLGKMYGPDLVDAMRRFKQAWDPTLRMNPGKVIDPFPLDANLRLGPDYSPPDVRTHFAFPDDHGSFANATTRCVGVGECRRHEHGTMCPSFMATREEKHSTRGRAHLLFEMLEGDPIRGGWRSEEVKDALDLCLACKGCKTECPVNVDMATYKAEFLAHYYEGRLRPRHAYAFGLIDVWARLGARLPGLANLVTSTPLLSRVAKWAADVAPEREIPAFAGSTFRRRFAARPAVSPRPGGPRVILWVDTFNDHFHPEVLDAAVEVLEGAGFEVRLSPNLCCGRPLYDYGMVARAKRYLAAIIEAMRDDLRAGTPIVALEPSCLATFEDELLGLFPRDEDAQRLSRQARSFAELVTEHRERFADLKLSRDAVVHGHCHQKALGGLDAEARALEALGVRAHVLDSGCCGMAGAFGYERDHYDVSMACGERVLLPAVRAAAGDALVVADGFSCRGQIEQATQRRGLHVAQVMALARRHGPSGPPGTPEAFVDSRPAPRWRAALMLTSLAALSLAIVLRRRAPARRRHPARRASDHA